MERPSHGRGRSYGSATRTLAIPVRPQNPRTESGQPDLTQLLPLLPHYVAGIGTATVGALLASRRPAHPVGWLLLVFGLATTVSGVVGGYALAVVVTRPEDLVTAGWARLLAATSFYRSPSP